MVAFHAKSICSVGTNSLSGGQIDKDGHLTPPPSHLSGMLREGCSATCTLCPLHPSGAHAAWVLREAVRPDPWESTKDRLMGPRRPCAGMGDPIHCVPGTSVVAVDCSLARSLR